jgi:hypothetical protein
VPWHINIIQFFPAFQYDDFAPDDPNMTIGYMIARPKELDPKLNPLAPLRLCFIYTYYNDTYSWTVDTTTCLRNIRPGQFGKFQFNTTKIGE